MHVLIVEDDRDIVEVLRIFVVQRFADAVIMVASHIADAKEKVELVNVVILDLVLADCGDPKHTLEEFVPMMTTKPFIVMSGMGDLEFGVRAMEAGAVDFVGKPFDAVRLNVALDLAMKKLASTE